MPATCPGPFYHSKLIERLCLLSNICKFYGCAPFRLRQYHRVTTEIKACIPRVVYLHLRHYLYFNNFTAGRQVDRYLNLALVTKRKELHV